MQNDAVLQLSQAPFEWLAFSPADAYIVGAATRPSELELFHHEYRHVHWVPTIHRYRLPKMDGLFLWDNPVDNLDGTERE